MYANLQNLIIALFERVYSLLLCKKAAQPEDLNASIPTVEAMEQHLEDKFDQYVYQIGVLKKTLHRLSLQYHGRILRHLNQG
jgi:hypothetical protein